MSGKVRSDPFHKFIMFPLSQLRKVQFVYVFFLISIFVGATAQHPQHTDDKGGAGEGPESGVGSLILCQRERKEKIRKKRGKKRSIEKKKKGERRDSSINNSILSSAGFITNRVLIAFDNFC